MMDMVVQEFTEIGLLAAAVVVAVLAHLMDIYTTMRVVNAGGTERNPIARRLGQAIGLLPALVLLKTVALAPGVALIYFAYPIYLSYAAAIWAILAVLGAVPAVLNFRTGRKMGVF